MDASGAADRETLAAQLAPHELAALGSYYWEGWARDEQLPPQDRASEIWRTWLICAGRGFGKTRAGAEWIRDVARNDGAARIALVGASLAEVRSVMVEGDSGVLAAAPGALAPVFEPSLKRLTWENGAQAFLYSAAEPESLRGPQHSHAWCDEIAKWDNASDRAMTSWNNLQLTMRLGKTPRVLATTTPRNAPLMRLLLADAKRGKVVVARGKTVDNREILALGALDQIAGQALQLGIDRILGGAGKSGGGIGGVLAGLLAGLTGLPGRATGGLVSPERPYLVGERGPELFVPASAGRVEPNREGASRGRDVRVNIALPTARGAEAPVALRRSARQIASAVRRAVVE